MRTQGKKVVVENRVALFSRTANVKELNRQIFLLPHLHHRPAWCLYDFSPDSLPTVTGRQCRAMITSGVSVLWDAF